MKYLLSRFLLIMPSLAIATSGKGAEKIPLRLPAPSENGKIQINGKNTTIIPQIQEHMQRFLANKGNQIAAVVLVEAKTGNILAMAQGKDPAAWNSDVNTALHNSFPAASLFKTVSAAAAIELTNMNPDHEVGLAGGCSHVMPDGSWLRTVPPRRNGALTLRKAYAHSCNGYFANLVVSQLGIGVVNDFAARFGFDKQIPADIEIPISPLNAPDPQTSSAATIGAYAAGFGLMGLTPVTAAWQMLAIANGGTPMPVRLFENSNPSMPPLPRLMSEEASKVLRDVMGQSVIRGTATSSFRQRKYSTIRNLAGGKTGTLNGKAPEGLTTWFAGLMPTNEPEVVVAAVTVAGDRWVIKGPQIASEALWIYNEVKNGRNGSYASDETKRRKRRKT